LPTDLDVEAQDGPDGEKESWRERLAGFLESHTFHKLVLTLIAIDAVCVIVDLSYSFLSDQCTPIEGEDSPVWLDVLANISLGITTFFLVEIPLVLTAFGFSYYDPVNGQPHAIFHLFDAVIIVITFVLEFILRGKERELAALLVLFRLWRLIKLVGGIAVGAGEVGEERDKQNAELRARVHEQSKELERLHTENADLRQRLNITDQTQ